MTSLYIGVYKVLYDYEARADEELSISADDLLYLLERSDVDDWWKCKKRVVPVDNEEVEEPVGLIPATYVEPAPALKTCTALYDYDKQTEEELSFKEGETFSVFDMNDPDWLLVGDAANTSFGFVPSNYIEYKQAPVQNLPVTAFAPPPVRKDRTATPEVAKEPEVPEDLDDAPPPPMPSRPESARPESARPEPVEPRPEIREETPPPMLPQRTAQYEPEEEVNGKQEHNFDGEFFRWYIDEVDGRKKRPIVFAVGDGVIIIKPNTSNPKKLRLKSASSLDNNWRLRDLTHYNHEKKHVFLEFQNPEASIELHAGTKDVADAIVAVLGDLKGAEAAKGLKEVARAASTKTSASNKKVGRLMYDFSAQGKDELLCREGDEVYVVDLTKSKEWWLCERTSDGKQGVVPSSYIEIVATTNLDKLTDGVQRRKSQRSGSSKGKVVDPAPKSRRHYHSRDERDKIRESDRKKRDKAKQHDEDKNMPNFHRVRTWIDSSGSFKVEAEFLGCMEGKIHLHKTNGVKIAVAATKLSIEDLEYVEKVTGTSLQLYKDEVARQMAKRKKSSGVVPLVPQKEEKTPSRSATAVINDVAPPKPSREKATSIPQNEPDYDWFEFFLSCGVDLGNCQRYSLNFSKEQMDESILEDITPSLLRSLGLREGDILRVMKLLDAKFDRKKAADASVPAGGLFTEPTGALKNNSTTEVSKVSASALPAPSPLKEPDSFLSPDKFEDDAWAVKPAARSSEDLSKTTGRPHYTGSLQDLVDIKPLEANKPPPTPPKDLSYAVAPAGAAMTPVRTGTMAQAGQTGSSSAQPIPAMRTGGLVPVPTGGLIPVRTGGLIPVQPTGFMPITAQPTGFMPIQPTGGIVPQFTFGIIPLQTGVTTFVPQKTGPQMTGPPSTSFGQANAAPMTTFGAPNGQVPMQPTSSFVPLQPTSSFVPLQQGNISMPQTSFGLTMTGQVTGGAIPNTFVPQSTFGKQITGGFMPSNTTGNMALSAFNNQQQGAFPTTSFSNQATGGMMPQTSFGTQLTGGMMPQTSFGQATGGFSSFGQPMQQNPSFGGQPQQNPSFGVSGQPMQQNPSFGVSGQPVNQQTYNPQMNQLTNMFQNTSIGGQYGQLQDLSTPQSAFGQAPQLSFGQAPQLSFGQAPQPGFGQPSFGQQPSTTFGQQPLFEGFGSAPLQSQPTGHGFGNAPTLQSQQTGRRANLQAATAENPFGF